jgi:hypothetical protein
MSQQDHQINWARHAILPYASLSSSLALYIAAVYCLPRGAGFDIFNRRYEYFDVLVFLPFPLIFGIIALRTGRLGANPRVGRVLAWLGIMTALLQLCIPWLSTGFYVT